jgi:hypothetical protein
VQTDPAFIKLRAQIDKIVREEFQKPQTAR